MTLILIVFISYLLGSIPSGFLAGKWISNIDLRLIGSGSTGATNVLRHVGKWPALVVFIVDVLKGAVAVLIAKHLQLGDTLEVTAGTFALLGHIWPVWLKWKGGKAVATGLGMLLGLSWSVGLASFGVFMFILLSSKIVSLSSICAAISLPILMTLSFQNNNFRIAYFIISLISMVIVLWRHRSNFKRILSGKEPKIGRA